MRAALLALAACQLSPALPLHYVQSVDTDPDTLANIELLIPLLVGEEAPRGRAQESREPDEHFSAIPASAFTLDEPLAAPAPPAPSAPAGSHKRDLSRQQLEPRLRSAYLDEPEDDGRDVWRACSRLARARSGPARQVLLYLCAELLEPAPSCTCCPQHNGPHTDPHAGHSSQHSDPHTDLHAGQSGSHSSPHSSPHAPRHPSPQERHAADPPWFGPVGGRRDLMPLGDNAAMVERYLHVVRKKPRPPWLME